MKRTLILLAMVFDALDGRLARMTRRPKRTKRELWGRLRGMGWTMGRVVESMDEIKDTLK